MGQATIGLLTVMVRLMGKPKTTGVRSHLVTQTSLARGSLLLGILLLLSCATGQNPETAQDGTPNTVSDSALETAPDAELAPPPPPPPDGAFIAQITPEQNQKLLELGIDIAVPTQVPPGFRTFSAITGTQPGGPSYMLIYQDQLDRCFAIEHTTEGVGGLPDIENKIPLNPPLFGEGYILYHGAYTDPALQADFPEPNLITDWMTGNSGFYRLIGAAYLEQNYPDLTCQDISPDEAVQVIDSLAYLATEIIGDGFESE
ncbi:MAG: hypothetical protein AAFX95_12360 [Cyanobacteria bacterium J06639_16]